MVGYGSIGKHFMLMIHNNTGYKYLFGGVKTIDMHQNMDVSFIIRCLILRYAVPYISFKLFLQMLRCSATDKCGIKKNNAK